MMLGSLEKACSSASWFCLQETNAEVGLFQRAREPLNPFLMPVLDVDALTFVPLL